MNKAELIDAIVDGVEGLSKAQVASVIDAFTGTVATELKTPDNKVTLVGFGTFSSKKRPAREGRNPATGEKLKIKAKIVAKFKPSKDLI